MKPTMLNRHRIGLVTGLFLGVAAAAAVAVLSPDPLPSPKLRPSIPALFDEDRPLGPDGVATTLQQAVSTSPIPVYRPESPLASDASIEGLWLRTAWLPEVFIRYDSGVSVSIREADFSNGFRDFYQAEIDQGFPGRLITIDQQVVFSTAGTGSGPGLDMQMGRWLVEVIGTERETEEDLLALAGSIIASQKLGTWAEIGGPSG
jgi:hypothetical protein